MNMKTVIEKPRDIMNDVDEPKSITMEEAVEKYGDVLVQFDFHTDFKFYFTGTLNNGWNSIRICTKGKFKAFKAFDFTANSILTFKDLVDRGIVTKVVILFGLKEVEKVELPKEEA